MMTSLTTTPRTVLIPFVNNNDGGSYRVAAQLVDWLSAQDQLQGSRWRAQVVVPARTQHTGRFGAAHSLELPAWITEALKRRFRQQGLAHLALYRAARRYLTQHPPDLLHIHDEPTLLTWGSAAKHLGIPVLWHVHNQAPDPLDGYYLHLCQRLVLVARANRARFAKRRLPPHHTIYNAVDTGRFYPGTHAQRQCIRRQLGLEPGRFTLGFVGHLAARKRPEWALSATLELLRRGLAVQLVMVGDDPGGGYRARLEACAQQAGASQHVHLLGYRDDVPAVLRACDALVLTSTHDGEAFPLVVLEAMASALPVVATRAAGVPEAVTDGLTGYLSAPDDFAGFVRALAALASQPTRAAGLGTAGYRRARSSFTPQSFGASVVAAYDAALTERRAPSLSQGGTP